MLREVIDNSIRCARHKLKIDQARFAVASFAQQLEATHVDDDIEEMGDDEDF
jgi:hypothetical protein